MSQTKCPSREELAAFALGNLSEETLETVAAHLESCPTCEAALVSLDEVVDSFVSELRCPGPAEGFLAETEFQQVAPLVAAIGREHAINDGSPDEPADGQSELGQLGHFQLLARLGEGGMGTVYKARHLALDKVVAVKVLPAGRMQDDQAVTRFQREMKAVGKLEHPNIVRAMDAGESDGRHFLAMEYLDGLDLSELVRRVGPLPLPDACELARQAAVGLQHAHEHGMIHRDVKPSNLMLTPARQVKILDLGLARLSAGKPAGQEITTTDQTMGTADYMAPEQASDSHSVDIRADIYSLGCTLYKLLTGEAPFTGSKYKSKAEKMAAHIRDPIPPISNRRGDVPKELAAVLDRMLSKAPADRLATPADVAESIKPFCTGCNLPEMLARARRVAESVAEDGKPATTDQHCSSALVGTEASEPAAPRRSLVVQLRHTKVVAIAAALAGILLLGVVVTLTTRHGTLVIETDDESVQIIVRQDGELVEVLDADSGWTIRLKSGEYTLEMQGSTDQLEISQDAVIVKRGDQVRVRITRKRTPEGIAVPQLPQPPPKDMAAMLAIGLVGHWAFEEGSGTIARDSADLHHDGTLKNLDPRTAWSEDVPLTSFGNRFSMKFDGEGDCVEVDGYPGIGHEGSVATWIKTSARARMYFLGTANGENSPTQFVCTFDTRDDAERGVDKGVGEISLYLWDKGLRIFRRFVRRPVGLSDGRWHHVVINWNGTTQVVAIHVDGVQQRVVNRDEGSKGTPYDYAPFEFPLRIGACNWRGQPGVKTFIGLLDDVRLYNRELTDDEIKFLAARAHGPVVTPNPVPGPTDVKRSQP